MSALCTAYPMKLPERLASSRVPWQRAARLGPLLAWSLALAVTAWVAADLFWRFSAPRAAALPVAAQADPQAAAQAIASRHLMGSVGSSAQAAAAVAPSRYAAHAVVTGADGRPGWAILSIDGGPQQGFVEGQPIQPGTTLARVRPEAVDIATGGATQTIALAPRSSGSSSGSSSAGSPSGAQAAPASPPAPPPGIPASQEFGGDATDPAPRTDAAQRPLAPGLPIRIPASPPTPSP